jgi:hypothetical protein
VPAFDRPRGSDTEQISDLRRAALECLASLLRGHRFTIPIIEAGNPTGVVVAVRQATRRMVSA